MIKFFRIILCHGFLLSCASLFAQDIYHVKIDGREDADGRSDATAWNLKKLSSTSLSPGSSVLFKRGQIFNFTLKVNQKNLTYGAYGEGKNPVISGLSELKSWSSLNDNIYYTTVDMPQLRLVTIDGNIKNKGRFPKSGYLPYTGHLHNESISGPSINAIPFNAKGGEVVIRKQRWILDRHPITTHSGNTIRYSTNTTYGNNGLYAPVDGNGYFIQNHIGTLTADGDWCYEESTKRLYIYFGSGDPTSRIVKASVLEKNVDVNSATNITFEGLTFEGANHSGSSNVGSSDIFYRNCTWQDQGGDAIWGGAVSNMNMQNCAITNTLNNGIHIEYDGSKTYIDAVKLNNTGTVPGGGRSGDGAQVGIFVSGGDTKIINSSVINTGYNGIDFLGGDNAVIERNLVDNFCNVKDDGGGIYTFTGSHAKIKNNVILNATGAFIGAEANYWEKFGKAAGIYLDNGVVDHHASVEGNTIAHGGWGGIVINNNGNNSLTKNIVFDYLYQLFLIDFDGRIRNITSKTNQYIAKTKSQFSFGTEMAFNDDLTKFGISDENIYARPIDDDLSVQVYQNYAAGRLENISLEKFRTLTRQDVKSGKSPKSVLNENEIFFYYNAALQDKTVSLPGTFIDFTGKSYNGSVTLKPYSSIALIGLSGLTPEIFISSNTTFLCKQSSIVFTAVVNNAPPKIKFQWKKNGINVLLTTANTFSPTDLIHQDVITCDLVDADLESKAIGSSNAITVLNNSERPTISIQSSSSEICEGATLTFTATVAQAPYDIKFIWKKNGITIDQANAAFYASSLIKNNDEVTCTISGEAGPCSGKFEITSNKLIIKVLNNSERPTISIQSSASQICEGATLTFTAAVAHAPNDVKYSWKKNGITIDQANAAVYASSLIKNNDEVTCTISGEAGPCSGKFEITSNKLTINVLNNSERPTISIQSSSSEICEGATVTFRATVAQAPNGVKYTWKKNGTTIDQANAAVYSSSLIKNNDEITCTISGGAGTCSGKFEITSNKLTIKVLNNYERPTISIQSSASEICEGATVTFTANLAQAPNDVKYTWKKNGTTIDQANASVYSSSLIKNNDEITCIISGEAGPCSGKFEITSNKLTIKVKALLIPSIRIEKNLDNISSKSTVTFKAIVENAGTSPSYNWKVNGIAVPGDGNTFTSSSLKDKDKVTCELTLNEVCFAYESVISNTIQIESILASILFANSFSPNGDGINDVWNIPDITQYNKAEIKIFSKEGRVLFHSMTGGSWDGKYNGTPCPLGTYFYILNFDNAPSLKGSLFLIN